MEDKRDREQYPEKSGKRKYAPPDILTQEVFETTALACMKVAGGGGCGAFPKS